MENRVVITGMGVISPLGVGLKDYWANIIAGKSGIRPIVSFDTSEYSSKLGGEALDFDPKIFISPAKIRRMDRTSHMAVSTSILALKDAGIDLEKIDRDYVAVILGSGFGGLVPSQQFIKGLFEDGPSGTNPMLFPNTVINAPASMTSIELGLPGINTTFSHKGVSAESAIIYACNLIKEGKASIAIAGGSDELSPILFHAFAKIGVLSGCKKNSIEGSFPFDARRNGMVLSEGAGIVILESADGAMRRGARIYAEIAGYGMTGANRLICNWDIEGKEASRAISLTLLNSRLMPRDVDYICASANSTKILDAMETKAIKDSLGEYAYKVSISSIKSSLGDFNSMGGLKIITTAMAIHADITPPTINQEYPGPECDLDYVPNCAKEKIVKSAVVTAFADGGSNICVALKKFSF